MQVDVDELRRRIAEGAVDLPATGSVAEAASSVPPWVLLDGDGRVVEPVAAFLRDLALSDSSVLTVRSYAFDLLRWWRLLALLAVDWERAGRAEVELLVGWMRSARNRQRYRRPDSPPPGSVNPVSGKRSLTLGYAPRTINHQLTVLSEFYAFHASFGRRPLINPVPSSKQRRDQLAHRSPIEGQAEHRRAPLRQRVPAQSPRCLPDDRFDDLFERMGNNRDRALLAIAVSSGARAQELLGIPGERVDWAGQRLLVVSKGSRALEPVPVSPQAMRWLAAYYDEHGTPAADEAVFRTLRGRSRPLTYGALRRVLQRANEALGSDWTMHDLRHTLIDRLTRDPAMTLPEIMRITRHRKVASMDPYLRPRVEEIFDKLQEHYTQPRRATTYTAGYDAADVATIFGPAGAAVVRDGQ